MNILTRIKILRAVGMFNHARSLFYGLRPSNNQMAAFYSRFIKKNDMCFDIGGNIGEKADIFLRFGARVIIVEPQPECVQFLRGKYRRNKNVQIINKALDSGFGPKAMYVCAANALSSMSKTWIDAVRSSGRYAQFHWNKKIMVETVTLDYLIREFGVPAFCKVDVEGYELNVCKGLTRPLRYMSFEIAPESAETVKQCVQYLSRLGPCEVNYSTDEIHWAMDQWLRPEQMILYLDSSAGRAILGNIFIKYEY